MCSSSPDTSGVNAAALANADIAREALHWYQTEYANQAPMRQDAADRANEVSDLQMAQTRQQMGLADEYSDYRRETFQPLEQTIVRDAMNFDTEHKREELAGLALGDVHDSFGKAREIAFRDATRHGVNPMDGTFRQQGAEMAMSEALAGANAKNKARAQAITMGTAMKADAANMGRGLPSAQATSAGLALTAGNSAASTAQIPAAVAAQGTQMVGQGYNTAIAANNSAGNLYGTAANIQQRADEAASPWAALGTVAGAFLGRR